MATPTTATPSGSQSASLPFDTVLRGYERRQVDEFVAKQKDELAKLQDELAEAIRKRRLANEHADFLGAVEPDGELVKQFDRPAAPKVGQLPVSFDVDRDAAIARSLRFLQEHTP